MKLAPKLILIIIPLTILSIGASAAVVYTATKTALQAQISTNQLETTRQTIGKVDQFLYERRIDIRALAERDQFKNFLASNTHNPAVVNASLQTHRDFGHIWDNFSILDLKGVTRASTKAENIGQNPIDKSTLLASLYQKVLTGQVISSDVFIDQQSQDTEPTAVYMAPVYNGQKIAGVIIGQLSWPAVTEILQSIKGATATLLNHDGKLIARNQSGGEILKLDYSQTASFNSFQAGQDGSQLLPGLNNAKEETVTSLVHEPGFLDYTGHGWYLFTSTPTKVAFAPAQQLAITLTAILVVSITLVIFVILYLLNRQIIRPIAELNGAVSRISLGDLSQTVPVQSGDEIGQLSGNFNEMTRQLAATYRHLQAASQQADERRAQLESSINGLRQGFIITDNKNKVVMANSAAQDLIREQGKRSHSSKKTLDLAVLANSLPADLKLLEAIQRTLDSRQLAKFSALPLGGRFLNLYLSPVISDDAAIGCVLLLEDVTEERILQRSRDEFFSIASHELRTPLTAIRGNTSLIQQYFPEALKDPSMNEMVDDIHDSAVRLIDIVNDFLDMSRLEQDKMKFSLEAFPIENIIEKIIYEMAGVSRDKEIFLNFDQHTLGEIPMVYADPNRVKQVLYNLVGNAMKFTDKGGVTINCLHEGNTLKVCVTDSGTGISDEGQQILFHKFQQTSENILTRDNTRGTGLGLYISKLLLEHMGGEISLEHTELGKGTTFSFTIPLANKEQMEQAKTKAAQLAATHQQALKSPAMKLSSEVNKGV